MTIGTNYTQKITLPVADLTKESKVPMKIDVTYSDGSAKSFHLIFNYKPKQVKVPDSTGEIDTLDFFLTKHSEGLLGLVSLIDLDKKRLYTLKTVSNSSRDFYELYSWDNQYIYLKEDRTARDGIYTFSDGKWMKRRMRVGEKITVNNNNIVWFDRNCKIKTAAKPFSYEITLESRIPNFKVGGLLPQDVIVVKYDSSLNNPTNGIYEKFYYSKEWGWIFWEEYTKNNPEPRKENGFVLYGGSGNRKIDTTATCMDR